MKLLMVYSSLIVLCSSNKFPLIPGYNNHYVEGETRFIWIPDSDDKPHLVDLHDEPDKSIVMTRTGANNQYWLYTRINPTTPQLITHGDKDSISKSNYDGTKPLKVIVHGWHNNGNANVNRMATSAFLAVLDTNIIVVDWEKLAYSNYILATRGIPSVGQYLGNFLIWLFDTSGGDWNNVHLVGFSLGAHAVGIAGRTVGGLPARISALDPAGPLWHLNKNALNTSSAQYVESIHTDGGFLGKFEPISHADFYPNGGQNPQPGCLLSTCSHNRSYRLFASSVQTDHFVGKQCNDIDEVQHNKCTGSPLNMGNSIITKRGTGIYSLTTGKRWPY